MTDSQLSGAIVKLLAYCEANEWAGHDPYDALNSKLLGRLSLLDFKLPRLVFTQALKRSPIDFRRLAVIPRTQNPKAIALFLSAFLKLIKAGAMTHTAYVQSMIERLITLRSRGISYWCWGYSFPWQMRTKLVPAGAPNLVCTSFAANALLDAYEQSGDARCLEMAVSAAQYMLNDLYWTEGVAAAGFGYPLPSLHGQVHNANLLAAALLYRVYNHTGIDTFPAPALRVARWCSSKQHADGSWYYGEEPSQRWIDNFHTGYNLCALRTISQCAETTEFDPCIERGYEFYRAHFIRDDGAPRYFHNGTYPIDIHCVAQSMITLLTFRDLCPSSTQMADSVFRWAMEHMWSNQGFFYYRVLRFCKIRTSYMRWSQAWMLLAMSTLLSESSVPLRHSSLFESMNFNQEQVC